MSPPYALIKPPFKKTPIKISVNSSNIKTSRYHNLIFMAFLIQPFFILQKTASHPLLLFFQLPDMGIFSKIQANSNAHKGNNKKQCSCS